MSSKILDTDNDTTHVLDRLKADGVECVIRYLTTNPVPPKLITPSEARAIARAGLRLGLVFEVYGGADDFTRNDINHVSGLRHGMFARNYAPTVGAPDGTIIYFAIDTNCTIRQYNAFVQPYFAAVKQALQGKYRVGMYGPGYALARGLTEGLIDGAWLTQSTGFNGYQAFKGSNRWTLLQGPEGTLHGLSIDTNTANGVDYGGFVPFANSEQPKPTPAPAPTPTPPPQLPTATSSLQILSDSLVGKIAYYCAGTPVVNHNWSDRGAAPYGYIKGMGAAFGLVYSKFRKGDPIAAFIARKNTDDDETDALAWYNSRFAELKLTNDTDGVDTLRHLFVLLTGLGVRESSGVYCEGRDRSASNVSADTAEAGLFQMSWNAHVASPYIKQLFDLYYPADFTGFIEMFRQGVHCSSLQLENYGEGPGHAFQALCKVCPAFAVEAAAVGLRCIRKHWGTINRHEAELLTIVDDMFKGVQNLVDADGATA